MALVTKRVLRPLRQFVSTEAAGGICILSAAVVALVWANSPWQSGYRTFFDTRVSVGVGSQVLDHSVRGWINDGLVTLFFFVAGLEIKREVSHGELRQPRTALLPVVAALGGMVVPGALYAVFNSGTATGPGWAIPMATDIAIALAVIGLIRGRRLPAAVSLLLLALAIVDDVGSMLVVAVFYSAHLQPVYLLGAAASLAVSLLARGTRRNPAVVHAVCGIAMWLSFDGAGIQPTLAGVVMGLAMPAVPRLRHGEFDEAELLDLSTPEAVRTSRTIARHAISEVERLEAAMHPWSSYLILPLFALANAGITFTTDLVGDLPSNRAALGVLVGRLIGKPLGIVLVTWLVVRLGWARLPSGVSMRHITGIGLLAGIGFTVAFFIAELSLDSPSDLGAAKLAVLIAGLVSGFAGYAVLSRGSDVAHATRSSPAGHPADTAGP